MKLSKKLTGYEIEYIPNIQFRLMSFALAIRDIIVPIGKRLDPFGIEEGFTVVDFGCGPGSYIKQASQLAGEGGRVYAVDVQPLAIKSIRERADKNNLDNVVPVLSTGYPVAIDSHSADIIYALDMFHHVKDTVGFLRELHRLLKTGGSLFIESGHQPMNDARQKIKESNCWVIVEEDRNLFRCRPEERESA